jgi:M6 family metalloprotease-like protein
MAAARRRGIAWLVVLALGLSAAPALGAPADPQARFELRQPDGRTLTVRPVGDEHNRGTETLAGYALVKDRRSGYWEYAERGSRGGLAASGLRPGEDSASGLPRHLRETVKAAHEPELVATPAVGPQRTLVILVQFANQAQSTTPASWNARFFGAAESVRDYYREVSYTKLDFLPAAESSGTANDGVVGWLTLPTNHPNVTSSNDDAGSARAKTAVRDAIAAANPFVNYAAFDTNGNGQLTPEELHITVIMAGRETASCGTGSVWAHKSGLSTATPTVDGVRAGITYTTFGEMQCTNGQPTHQATLGVIVHELGHDIGWPDLYDTDGSTQQTDNGGVGSWSVMAAGTWTNTAGRRRGEDPTHPDAFLKAYQGWLTPTQVVGTGIVSSLAQTETTGAAVQLLDNPGGVNWVFGGASGTGEYFLVENRQRVGYDRAIPGCGILVWRIDETRPTTGGRNGPNADDQRRLVQLLEADNDRLPFEAADAWTGARTLDDASAPNTRLVSGASTGVSLNGFGTCGANMNVTATAPGTPTAPASDAFATAARATTLPYRQTGVATGSAGIETGEPVPGCGGIGKTVWFRYTAERTGTLVADTTGSSFDTLLAVYRGTSLAGLTAVACNDDIDRAANNLRSKAQFAVTAGQTYYFQAGGFKATNGVVASGSLTFSLAEVIEAPANDAFAQAVAVGALPFTRAAVDTRGATDQAGEPTPSCAAIGRTVWFRYTPTASGTVVADTVGSDFDTVLAVHRGTALGALTQVGCNDDITPQGETGTGNLRSRVQFAVTAGETYYLQAGGYRGQDGATAAGTLTVNVAPAATTAPNDAFADAVVADALPFTRASLDTRQATIEATETASTCGGIGKTVWFRYTAPANGTLIADTTGSDYDTVLAVRRGTALGALTQVACNDDIDGAAGNRRSRVEFAVEAGQTYQFQVGSYFDGQNPSVGGTLTFSLTAVVLAPVNDAFAQATVATAPPFTRTLDTDGAGSEAGEPAPSCASIGRSVWFRYTPAANATLVADTIGSDFDTVLAVHRGTALGALNEVACNDDIDRAANNLRSRAEFAVTAGQTYYVQVGGFRREDGTIGSGGLTFTLSGAAQTAPNNAFASATAVNALPFSVTGLDTRAATFQTGEPVPDCTDGIGRTVWFRYAPAADATLSIDTAGSDFDTVLAVYRGTALDTLTEVACSDDIDRQGGNLRSRLRVGVLAGQTYYVQAGGYYDGTTALGGVLHLQAAAVAPEPAVTGGPPDGSLTTARAATFTFSAVGATGFECRLDGGTFAPCTSPVNLTALTDGQHSFVVRALWAGGAPAAPVTRTWTVDGTAPETTITGGPAEGVTVTSREADVAFASESGATFECRVDSGAWAGCGSPHRLRDLADGRHRFEVRARDEAGNIDASPAARTWSVDAGAPDTVIGDGPPEGSITAARDARFGFSSEAGAQFECRLDGTAFVPCGSPVVYAGLGDGAHTFEVRAVDAVGNADPSPAQRSWAVDATAPDTTITAGVGEGATVEATTAAFGFASEPGATFECRIDGGAWVVCSSPQTYSLAVGAHRFEVRAADAAGNVDASPAARAWTIAKAEGGVLSVSVSGQRLAPALRRGVLVRFSCPRACRPSWRVQLSAAEARRLKLGRRAVVIGRGKASRAVTSGSARIKLTARARRAIGRARRVTVTVTSLLDGKVVDSERVQLRR